MADLHIVPTPQAPSGIEALIAFYKLKEKDLGKEIDRLVQERDLCQKARRVLQSTATPVLYDIIERSRAADV